MKLELAYVTDTNGKPKMVQLPLSQWKRIVSKLEKYEQVLKLKEDLQEAFNEVESMKGKKNGKKTLSSYIHEL